MSNPTFTVRVELEHLSGPEQDRDTLIDYFAGTIGEQNAAPKPLRLTIYADENTDSIYRVREIS